MPRRLVPAVSVLLVFSCSTDASIQTFATSLSTALSGPLGHSFAKLKDITAIIPPLAPPQVHLPNIQTVCDADMSSVFQAISRGAAVLNDRDFFAAMERLGFGLSVPERRNMFDDMDSDGNGLINYDDFRHTVRRHGQVRRIATRLLTSHFSPQQSQGGLDLSFGLALR